MVIGIAFAEMVIAFRIPTTSLEMGRGGPSLESIHDVWGLGLVIGLTAVLISWIRESRSAIPKGS